MNKEIYDITDLYEAVKINDELKEENHNLCKELERYKNIIDELEKAYNKMEEKQVEIDGRGYYYTDLIPIEEIIDKLKELKGSDN